MGIADDTKQHTSGPLIDKLDLANVDCAARCWESVGLSETPGTATVVGDDVQATNYGCIVHCPIGHGRVWYCVVAASAADSLAAAAVVRQQVACSILMARQIAGEVSGETGTRGRDHLEPSQQHRPILHPSRRGLAAPFHGSSRILRPLVARFSAAIV